MFSVPRTDFVKKLMNLPDSIGIKYARNAGWKTKETCESLNCEILIVRPRLHRVSDHSEAGTYEVNSQVN